MELKLHSPVGAEPVIYPWPGTERFDSAEEIYKTIKMVTEEFPELKLPMKNFLSKIKTATNFNTMQKLCNRFNDAADAVAALKNDLSKKTLSTRLLHHIVKQTYIQSIFNPNKLNKYEPFSPQVYGECSFDFIFQLIEKIGITSDDVFIDLGSGVGQVVLQMAAANKCKMCIGIEKAEIPCRYAEIMSLQFKKWMSWYGKLYGDYKLLKGDFLSEEHRKTIISSSIIFVNNFAFGPTVDHRLKEIFADLRDGTRIISSKSFCPLNFRITDRNLSDIGTIMHVSDIDVLKGTVSWTDKPVPYYLHIIDRTKLERYFLKLKYQRSTRRQRKSIKNPSSGEKITDSTYESQSTDSDSFPKVMTRRAWSDYVKAKYL